MNPLSGVFGEAWEMYKAHWRHFFFIALVIYAIVAVISILLTAIFGWLGFFLAALVAIAGSFWVQGTLIEAVRDVRDGRADLSVRETLNRVMPVLNRIVIAGIALGLVIGLGLILLIVPGLVFLTFFIFVIPAIVLENRGIRESFGRSRDLVRGHGWQVFGVIVLTFLLLLGVSIVLGLILSPLEEWLASLLQQLIGNTLVAPFAAVVWTLAYYRLHALERPAETPAPVGEPGLEG
ncbi:MAG: DUF7544 domain-containing protein [Gaiellaceae bacterium]